MASEVTRDEQLAWEERWAKPAAAAGVGAIVLTIAAGVLYNTLFKAPTGPPGPESLLAVAEQPSGWLWANVVRSLPVLALLPVLLYVERAAAFRGEVMKAARVLAVVGPILLAGVGIGNAVVAANLADTFQATPQAAVLAEEIPDAAGTATSPAAVKAAVVDAVAYSAQVDEAGNVYERIISGSTALGILQGVGQAGALALGFALIIIAQAGLKAGLTSRFLGYIGIAVGAFYGLGALVSALGLGGAFDPLALQIFWLGALALIFIDRWPNGRGPAWDTGTAKPWPTAVEQREAYERRVEARQSQLEPPPEAAGDEPPAENGSGGPAPGSRKKKKRR
jgi:hypothetical protein